jgi:hypothetical protein
MAGLVNNGVGDYHKRSGSLHVVTPRLNLRYNPTEKLAIKSRLNLPLTFGSTTNSELDYKDGSKTDLVKDGTETTTGTFVFEPQIILGVQYKIVPDKLSINFGGTIAPTKVTTTTIKHKKFVQDEEKTPDGSETLVDVSDFNATFASVSTTLGMGITFYFTPNFVLDASTGVHTGSGISVMNTILNFSSISMHFKF